MRTDKLPPDMDDFFRGFRPRVEKTDEEKVREAFYKLSLQFPKKPKE